MKSVAPQPVPATADSTWLKTRQDIIRAELDYYLERHNVADEGFMMVSGYVPSQQRTFSHESFRLFNVGRWKDIARQGGGLERDHLGRVIIGNFDNDTLVTGIRIDPTTTYMGAFSMGMANGHGQQTSPDGHYFEGHFSHDMREGFGFSVSPTQPVCAGQWHEDRYLGERMNYTSERIYGIDISRYQHGKGKQKFSIQWNRLRISYLGHRNHKNVSGTADYPVSFIFLKSTEGTNITNPYYPTDYAQARRHGIPTGCYHFFSTKSDGAEQARHFLQHTQFRQGDLPPVLDVEPSDQQIERMGGPTVLFNNIRTWLQAVEKHTGMHPILYVNQMFINKYLAQAPDLKRGYPVWIARYSEYKPGMKLLFWQLSADGRVQGIRGEVDINVFNGYKPQFEQFLEENRKNMP